MKDICVIVLTGGPCAGKTTAFARIVSVLSDMGYKVFVGPETITEMFNAGIKIGDYSTIDFQTMLLKMQIAKEDMYYEAATLHKNEKVVILLDRGAIDALAYMNPSMGRFLLDSNGYRDNMLKSRYNGVIHMVTAADGAEEAYIANKGNNKARYEDVEQAIAVDKALIDVWLGHPHWRIVNNSCDFDTKIARVLQEIFAVIGQPAPLEVARKYLIDMPSFEVIKSKAKVAETHIIQTYLCEDGSGYERRIRQSGEKGDYIYSYTEKQRVKDGVKLKKERLISEKEYLELLFESDCRKKQITKTRYCFAWNNMYFEVDVFPAWDQWAILEVKLTTESETLDITIPDFLNVVKDVTDDEAYSNYALANRFPL